MTLNRTVGCLLLLACSSLGLAQQGTITSFDREFLTWQAGDTNLYYRVEYAKQLSGPWEPIAGCSNLRAAGAETSIVSPLEALDARTLCSECVFVRVTWSRNRFAAQAGGEAVPTTTTGETLTLTAFPWQPGVTNYIAADLATTDVRFWVLQKQGTNYASLASQHVPLIEDQMYGWHLKVLTSRTNATWSCIQERPGAPETWGNVDGDPDYEISADRTTVTSRPKPVFSDGSCGQIWLVEAGDPAGLYRISVFADQTPVHTFDFEVR